MEIGRRRIERGWGGGKVSEVCGTSRGRGKGGWEKEGWEVSGGGRVRVCSSSRVGGTCTGWGEESKPAQQNFQQTFNRTLNPKP